MIAATGGAAAAAAAAARLRQQEEEEMTSYSPKELAEDWEFKILRSNTAAFRNPAKMRAILDEESRGGWVLVEKFDSSRIRLKRPAQAKVVEHDFANGYDPYRTEVGLSGGAIAAIIISCFVVFFGMMLLLALGSPMR